MLQKAIALLLFITSLLLLNAAKATDLGLPEDFDRDPNIMSPMEFWGFDVGDYHPRHDQINAYFQYLAENSERVSLEISGFSHDRRPIILAVFASPERDIAEIKNTRRAASRSGEGPVIAWMGYSVHGNEASAASAAVQTAYYLAASRDSEVQSWLDEMVVVMEPVLNPDGLDRFAHWVNMHRGQHPSSDPNDREHNEIWPNGRTNYYWFDLNRDWMPQVHPESRARMAQYYAWQPHLVTDFHEMGRNSTYFFQPGVPNRNNPLTPSEVFEITANIATHHAKAMDQASESYYTKESFDDYYVGKGSTYPDITGGVGILFEQGSSRGHVQDTDFGQRTFADAIANQVITSLSSLRGAAANAEALKAYQKGFFETAREIARDDRDAGWVIGDGGDLARAGILIDRLLQHQIEIYPTTEAVSIDGVDYAPGNAWVIPANQDQYRLIKSMFDPVTELSMETFYDVSTWPLGMSYDLPLAKVRRLPNRGNALTVAPKPTASPIDPQAVAWVIPWNQYHASGVLAGLNAQGYRVQTTMHPMTVQGHELVRGSLVIHRGIQPSHLPNIAQALEAHLINHPVKVYALASGLAQSGPDLGSPSVPVVPKVRAAMIVGSGVNVYNAGYIWYWFDHHLKQPIAKIDTSQVSRVDWSDYTHIILPEGAYGRLGSDFASSIRDFVRSGGVVIANRSASTWIETVDLGWSWADESSEEEGEFERRAYEDYSLDFAREVIGGSALSIDLDITHPLGFGYTDSVLTVFRRGAHALKTDKNHYTRAGLYQDPVLASGYLGENNQSRLPNTPALVATRHGRGVVVRMADDYLFRGYWLGTERVFANAVFFSPLIGTTRLPRN